MKIDLQPICGPFFSAMYAVRAAVHEYRSLHGPKGQPFDYVLMSPKQYHELCDDPKLRMHVVMTSPAGTPDELHGFPLIVAGSAEHRHAQQCAKVPFRIVTPDVIGDLAPKKE